MKMTRLFMACGAICLILTACSEGYGIDSTLQNGNSVTFVQIAQGELYGNGQEGIIRQNLVITSNEEWNDLITAMNAVNNVTESFTETEIDFSRYRIIAVFDGVKPNGGWSIDIKDITDYKDSIVVTYTNFKSGNLTNVTTQPYHIVKIAVAEKEIVFKGDCDEDDIEYPIEISFEEYTLDGTSCQWTNFNYDYTVFNSGKMLIVNSNEELENYINCSDYPEINFDKYSLIIAWGVANNSIGNIEKQLMQTGDSQYNLSVTIELGYHETVTKWLIAILLDKLSDNTNITLSTNIINNPF
jgi:hypothetical protein